MAIIPGGKPIWFHPSGEGQWPRVKLTRMLRNQPGDPGHSHWKVEIFGSEGRCDPQSFNLNTWKDVDREMTGRYGPAFRERFPWCENVGPELTTEGCRPWLTMSCPSPMTGR